MVVGDRWAVSIWILHHIELENERKISTTLSEELKSTVVSPSVSCEVPKKV